MTRLTSPLLRGVWQSAIRRFGAPVLETTRPAVKKNGAGAAQGFQFLTPYRATNTNPGDRNRVDH
jgi:hypothetical protein